MYRLRLDLGLPEVHSSYVLLSSLDIDMLPFHFTQGAKILGFNIMSLFEANKDTILAQEHIEMLSDTGFEIHKPDKVGLGDFLFIYMHTVSLSDPSFRFSID